MLRRASLFAIGVLFLYGSPAYALKHVAPPGNSGASQYQEDVPSAGGGVPINDLPSNAGTQTTTPSNTSQGTTTPPSTGTQTTPPSSGTQTTTAPSATTTARTKSAAAVPSSVLRSLERAGAAGRQAAELAERTAPSVVGIASTHGTSSERSTGGSTAGGARSIGARQGSTSALGDQLATAVVGGGGGGLGVLLPLVLGASLLCAVGVTIGRRRRRG